MKRLHIERIIEAVSGTYNQVPMSIPFIQGVSTDSRQVRQGDLYIPIVGDRFDGHDFIGMAYEGGAVLCLCTSFDKVPQGMSAICVKDTKLALGKLASYYRSLFDIPVIAITGSVGKTSTKEMMASVLAKKYKVHKTIGNYNNDIGMPLTLLAMEQDHEVAVIEIGMNHFGEIAYLSDLLRPTFGVITNIGVSHIEFLGSREGILKAKTEMIPFIDPQGALILCEDDDLLRTVKNPMGVKRLSYGSVKPSDCTLLSYSGTQDGGQKMLVSTEKGTYHFTVDYPGKHILFNAMPAILIGEILGLSKDQIEAGVLAYVPAAMRLNKLELGNGALILDDAYNASVDSMASAIDTTINIPVKGRRILILGDMFEMGNHAKAGHEKVGKMVAKAKVDMLVCLGDLSKFIASSAEKNGMASNGIKHYATKEAFLADGLIDINPDDLILIKASRGMKLELIRDTLVERYSL